MLTARDDEIDRVVGLEIGADDYVTKPFSVRELQARIKALLRRHALLLGELESRRAEAPLVDGDLVLDRAAMRLEIAGRAIELRPKEFDLLEHLLANRGRVISSADLIRQVWGHDFVEDTRTVRVHISLLRGKIEADPARPSRIQTVRGSGYRYAPPLKPIDRALDLGWPFRAGILLGALLGITSQGWAFPGAAILALALAALAAAASGIVARAGSDGAWPRSARSPGAWDSGPPPSAITPNWPTASPSGSGAARRWRATCNTCWKTWPTGSWSWTARTAWS